jgi:magnesium transporter
LAYLLGGPNAGAMGVSVTLSIFIVSGVSSVLGTSIPGVFQRYNRDPAIAAGPFITMLIDMIAIGIYLAIVNRLVDGS